MDRVRVYTILYGTSAGTASTSETYTQFHRSQRRLSDDEFLRWTQEQFHHRQSEQERPASASPGGVEPWQIVMDLPANANREEIKARYRDLVKTIHPNAGGNAGDFIRLHEAYLEGTRGQR